MVGRTAKPKPKTGKKIKIKRAGLSHIRQLGRWNYEVMMKDGRKRSKPRTWVNAMKFAAMDVRGPRATYVALDGKKIIGAATLTEPMKAQHTGGNPIVARHLSSIDVKESHQGRRISSKLIDRIIDEHGHEPMMAGTRHERLQASFPKRGFQRIGDITGGDHPEMQVSKGVPLFLRKPQTKR